MANEKGKKPEKEAKPQEEKKNGVRRPAAATATRKVWDIADRLTAKGNGEPALRKDVVDEFVAKGGVEATGNTQYARWVRFNGFEEKIRERRKAERAEKEAAAQADKDAKAKAKADAKAKKDAEAKAKAEKAKAKGKK